MLADCALLPSLLLAQPAEWVPVPTNAAGTLLGTVTVGGEPAQAGDWVAAFDETGVCAGATEVVLNDGDELCEPAHLWRRCHHARYRRRHGRRRGLYAAPCGGRPMAKSCSTPTPWSLRRSADGAPPTGRPCPGSTTPTKSTTLRGTALRSSWTVRRLHRLAGGLQPLGHPGQRQLDWTWRLRRICWLLFDPARLDWAPIPSPT